MRIIGQIEHPTLKITVFKMDNKLSVKFETGLYEQTFKFRESEELRGFEDMQKVVDQPFINFVLDEFSRMHRAKNEAIGRALPLQEQQEFEAII